MKTEIRVGNIWILIVITVVVLVCVAILSHVLPPGKPEGMNSLAQAFFYSVSGVAIIYTAHAWRRNLLSEKQIDLAAAIISGVYKLRDEVKTFRLEATYGMENPIDGQKLKILEERFVPVEQAMSDLYKFIPLSKAFFAKDLENLVTPLVDEVKQLRTASRVWTMMQGTEQADSAYKKLVLHDKSDTFQSKINELVESVITQYAQYVR